MKIRNKTRDKKEGRKSRSDASKRDRFLILHNDDKNAYDYVIDTLVQVCAHDMVQAEQCTFIAHHKGKCDIKKGAYKDLKILKQRLAEKGLYTTIG